MELYLERTYGKNVILMHFSKETEGFLDQLKKQFSLKFVSDWLHKVSPVSYFI